MKTTMGLLFPQPIATWFRFSGPRERQPGLNLVFLSYLKIQRVEKFLIFIRPAKAGKGRQNPTPCTDLM